MNQRQRFLAIAGRPRIAYRVKRSLLSLLLSVLAAVLLALFIMAGLVGGPWVRAATADSTHSSSCAGWSTVPSPNPTGALETTLNNGVAVVPSDVWAVGFYLPAGATGDRTLIEQWNGAQWTVVPSPNPASALNDYLYGVAHVPHTSQLWAVGYSSTTITQTLIEHWDGAHWSIVTSPNVGSSHNLLLSVAAISSTDVWAVGYYYDLSTSANQTLIEHWNGAQWNVVASPNPAGASGNVLTGVAAVSANDVWAVAWASGSTNQSLIEHWDGVQWSVVPSPTPAGTNGHGLLGVAAIASANVWAVGDTSNPSVGLYQTVIEHWDRLQWSVVPSPNPGGAGYSILYGVAAVSSTNVWALGFYLPTGATVEQTLIEHWNGSRWSVVASPNVGMGSNTLLAVARVPRTGRLWAVGYYHNTSTGYNQALIERHC